MDREKYRHIRLRLEDRHDIQEDISFLNHMDLQSESHRSQAATGII